MRPSQFVYTNIQNNKTILYNTLNKSILEVDRRLTEKQVGFLENFSEDELKVLVDCNFYVEDNYDDLQEAKDRLRSHWENQKTAEFVILTTNGCNCDCIYCYEKGMYGNHKVFSDFGSLDVFLSECSESGLFDDAHLSFHGGEPTLYPDLLVQLHRSVNKYFKDIKTTMVSNGVLIHTQPVVNALKEVDLQKVLITVDGTKATHDRRRPLKNGESAYDNIMLSLETLKENNLPVHISINIDSTNFQDIDHVYENVIRKYAPDDFYIAMVVSGEKHPYPDGLTEAEYSDIISSFYEKHGVSIKGTRDIRDEYFGTFLCSSRAKNVFIIDSLGDLYNCVSLTGNKKYSLGNINGGFDFISKKMEEHMKRTFTSSCRKCKFLPICYGGCRLERITGEHNNGCLKDHFNYILPRVLEWKIAERSE